ncbi:hypothetical protein [Dyella terrae]|uniref:hypothetical protein n=1 Tax=Dyella terrae TaxID=522259 RepID=UPI001EFC773D|nr:hypothetical protein [Dyella terrae]ULU24983.1 hypothetical protein DYST_01903 [Dyella terrae]
MSKRLIMNLVAVCLAVLSLYCGLTATDPYAVAAGSVGVTSWTKVSLSIVFGLAAFIALWVSSKISAKVPQG